VCAGRFRRESQRCSTPPRPFDIIITIIIIIVVVVNNNNHKNHDNDHHHHHHHHHNNISPPNHHLELDAVVIYVISQHKLGRLSTGKADWERHLQRSLSTGYIYCFIAKHDEHRNRRYVLLWVPAAVAVWLRTVRAIRSLIGAVFTRFGLFERVFGAELNCKLRLR